MPFVLGLRIMSWMPLMKLAVKVDRSIVLNTISIKIWTGLIPDTGCPIPFY